MTEEILRCLLLLLGMVWAVLAIAYIATLLVRGGRPSREQEKATCDKPTITREQVEEARHILVGRSKPFVAPFIPKVPAPSSSEKAVDNPPTFAEQTAQSEAQKETEEERDASQEAVVSEEEEHREGENELQVAYTMEEISEEEILREELQIADEAMPEMTPTAILSRDLAHISRWSKEDESVGEDEEKEMSQTLRTLRGTELMERLKECTQQAEQVHRNLLTAIRKAEEKEEETLHSSAEEAHLLEETTISDDKPLSYYL